MHWSALNQELAQDGAPGVEYQRFVARWNDPNDQAMQAIKKAKLIKKFDKNGIVINTRAEREEGDEPEVNADGSKGNDILDRTAKSAAKRMK